MSIAPRTDFPDGLSLIVDDANHEIHVHVPLPVLRR